eukprot:5997730-Prymnesium_polylepis.1
MKVRNVVTADWSSFESGPGFLKIAPSASRARCIASSERVMSPAVRMPAVAAASRTSGSLSSASSVTAHCTVSAGSALRAFSRARCAARSRASSPQASPQRLTANAAYRSSVGM